MADRRQKPNRYVLILKNGLCRIPYLVKVDLKKLKPLERRKIERMLKQSKLKEKR